METGYGRRFTTIPSALIGYEENGKTSLLRYSANSRPDRKKYEVGHDVLLAKTPEDLPIFFRKVGHLAMWSTMSLAKARQLLRDAVYFVGEGTGLTYRLRDKQADCLKWTAPQGLDLWVVVEARKIGKRIKKEQEERAARRKWFE